MRTFAWRVLMIGVLACALDLLSLQQAALGAEPQMAPEPSAAGSVFGETEEELHYRRRLPRFNATPQTPDTAVDSSEYAMQHQVSASLRRWLKHFGNPVVCNMIFCHTSCADYDDSCPSFGRPLLENMLDDYSGCMSQPRALTPRSQVVLPPDSCCIEEDNSLETFRSQHSQSN